MSHQSVFGDQTPSLAMFNKGSYDSSALFSAPSVCLGSSDFPQPAQLFLQQGVKMAKICKGHCYLHVMEVPQMEAVVFFLVH